MNLIQIEKKLPDIFHDINSKMKSSVGDPFQFAIAGGSLCDVYMEKEFRDIDVFVSESSFDIMKIGELFGVEPEKLKNENSTYFSDDISFVYSFSYKEHTIEIITVNNIRRIFDFDFRFRQFYFINDVFYSTKEALKDIKEKKLVLVNSFSGVSSLCRMHYFMQRYQFKMEQKSMDYLFWFLNKDQIKYDETVSFVQNHKKLTEKQKSAILSTISSVQKRIVDIFHGHEEDEKPEKLAVFNGKPFPFHPMLEDRMFKYLKLRHFNHRTDVGVLGPDFQKLENWEPLDFVEPFTFSFTKEDKKEIIEHIIDSFLPYFKKYRMHYVATDKSDLLNCFHYYIENKDKKSFDLENFYYQNRPSLKNFFNFSQSVGVPYHYEFYDFIVMLETHTENTLKDEFYAEMVPESNPFKFGDLLRHNSLNLEIRIKNKQRFQFSTFSFRKCDNGKYTFSELAGGLPSSPKKSMVKKVFSILAHKYPDFFEFGNVDAVGIFHRGSNLNEYFFPLSDNQESFPCDLSNLSFEDLKKKIDLKKR